MRKCGSCFRYIENWRDAEAKGLEPRYNGSGDYYYKPRKGIKPQGMAINCHDEISENCPACKYHEYRWIANFKTWYIWHFKRTIQDWYREKVRVPLGSLRSPIPLEWQDSYNGMADRIIPNGEPVCPRCRQMPYSLEQCVFCGQRFKEESV